MKRTYVLFISLFTCFSLFAANQDIDVEKILLERMQGEQHVGMAVGIIEPNKTTFHTYGTLSVDDTRPIDEDTLFEIGSLSKLFTTLLLQDMNDKKELSLNDPLEKFLPSYIQVPKTWRRKILLKDLASHTSGLPYMPYNYKCLNISNPFANYSMEEAFEFLNSYKLPRTPGKSYDYSNIGLGMLAYVLSSGSRQNYEHLLQTRICAPLHLENTTLFITPEKAQRLAKAHVGQEQVPNWDFTILFGSGGLFSTIKDLTRFLEASMGRVNTILSESMKRTHTIYCKSGDEPYMKIALGWHRNHRFSSPVLYHNGITGGCRSFICFCPDTQRGVVILSNSSANIKDLGFHIVNPNYELSSELKEITLDPAILDQYLGVYRHPTGLHFTIVKKNNHLVAKLSGYPCAHMYPETTTRFFVKAVTAPIDFFFDENNQVTSLRFTYAGAEHMAIKVK